MNIDAGLAKSAARRLRTGLADRGHELSHSEALELVAQQLGFRDWNTATALLADAADGPTVPVLRVQDVDVALEFYEGFLGFRPLWRHQFEPETPWYVRVQRRGVVLDLSEHYGDGTPGSVVWIAVASITDLLADLSTRPSNRARPGIDREAPGGPTMTLTDPYGNVLRFCQPQTAPPSA